MQQAIDSRVASRHAFREALGRLATAGVTVRLATITSVILVLWLLGLAPLGAVAIAGLALLGQLCLVAEADHRSGKEVEL